VPQITYAESIVSLEDGEIVVERALPLGREFVKCNLPCLLTVVASANQPRPASARKRIEYKLAATPLEYQSLLKKWPELESEEALDDYLATRNMKIPLWSAADLGVDEGNLGLSGSPTQVYKVNYVVLETAESKEVSASEEGIATLFDELIQEYIVG
jgi:electron transfer flavoprotein alpha/beta subunit